jgi:hypothetical protein
MECTLHRRSGSPIPARTVDVGPGGMCVATQRPLTPDEVVSFELSPQLSGRARVLRQQGYSRYSVRFEALAQPARAELDGIVALRT